MRIDGEPMAGHDRGMNHELLGREPKEAAEGGRGLRWPLIVAIVVILYVGGIGPTVRLHRVAPPAIQKTLEFVYLP